MGSTGQSRSIEALRASLTLEAALVLPLVIFASVCLMLPGKAHDNGAEAAGRA